MSHSQRVIASAAVFTRPLLKPPAVSPLKLFAVELNTYNIIRALAVAGVSIAEMPCQQHRRYSLDPCSSALELHHTTLQLSCAASRNGADCRDCSAALELHRPWRLAFKFAGKKDIPETRKERAAGSCGGWSIRFLVKGGPS